MARTSRRMMAVWIGLGVLINLLLALGVVAMRREAAYRSGNYRAADIMPEIMTRWDPEGGGRISRAAYLRYGSAATFDRYDANHDGYWSRDEFVKALDSEDPEAPGPP